MAKELTEIQKLWVKDLRENPELQGKHYLFVDGCFCCLGRGVVIVNATKPENQKVQLTNRGQTNLSYDLSCDLGLRSTEGLFYNKKRGHQSCLAYENDYGTTFLEIADLIEEYAEELFV